jgi:dipeptidyl aminopeptidase/acylaminoacyl peptidase
VRLSAFALALFASSQLTAHAQQSNAAPAPVSTSLDGILSGRSRAHIISQVAISPDGKRLAWLQSGEIHVALIDKFDSSQRITAAVSPNQSCTESNFTWSPDSASLAFFSDCANAGEQTDLFVSRLDGTPPRRLTILHGDADSPAFSPDGSRIAFLYVEGATRPAGALAAIKPPSGVIGEDGIEIQRVAFAAAGASQPAAPEFATPVNLHVYEFDWSPDSKSLAYIAADPPGENNWWVAKLYTQIVGAPGLASETWDSKNVEPPPTAILSPSEVSGPLHGLQIAVPRWSPDGKSIALIGGLMSDQGVTGGDVWIVSSTGGEPRDLTPNRPSSPAWIAWDGNERLIVSEIAGGSSSINFVAVDAAQTASGFQVQASLLNFPGILGDGLLEQGLSISANRSIAVFRGSTFNNPPEIYVVYPRVATAAATQLSHINEGLTPSWGNAVSINWTNENFRVQGWLLMPAHYDPAKKYPLIVHIHGGPASAVLPRWDGGAGGFSSTAFSALDYFVLMPNPRGSYGQGEAFTEANRKDFGYGDLRDILVGVDAVLAKYSVDPNRVGIAGWSYGGFMTMFALTQTRRFRAGVAGAGISDWLSYYGENSIDQWMIPYFGASVYDDPQVYAKSSAINYIKNVTAPALAVVGDRDGECPAPQSFEFWHALRDLNVPAQLVVYPNEGHGFMDPAHRRDVNQRAVDWFAKYMPPAQ